MSKTVKAADARGFLSVVPSLLGYIPVESIVVIPFKGSMSLGAMRFDLPKYDAQVENVASTLVGMLCRVADADGAVVVAYTEQVSTQCTAILEAMEERMDMCGIRVQDVLYVAADGWGSLIEGAAPRPVSELTPPEGVVAPTKRGQLDGTQLPHISTLRMGWISDAFETTDLPAQDSDWIALFERLSTEKPDDFSAETVVLAAATMEAPSMRDTAMMQSGWGQGMGDQALAAQRAWEQGTPYPVSIAGLMHGDGPRPNPARLENLLEAARLVAGVVDSAGALSVAAWTCWALGRSSHAEHYAKQGLKIDPGHGLCEIVATLVNAGHLPDWAFTK